MNSICYKSNDKIYYYLIDEHGNLSSIKYKYPKDIKTIEEKKIYFGDINIKDKQNKKIIKNFYSVIEDEYKDLSFSYKKGKNSLRFKIDPNLLTFKKLQSIIYQEFDKIKIEDKEG